MAFNNYDKLTKAQRDYPKPKFASSFIDKQLKKNSLNAYLLTWRADVRLQQGYDPGQIHADLKQVLNLPSFVDPQLMSYWYKIAIETLRRCGGNPKLYHAGTEAIRPWASLAKSLQRSDDRRQLWETLFSTALQQDCWEDARNAVVNYSKESKADKKQLHYTLIFAAQMAAEQKAEVDGPDDPVAKIQFMTALRYLKQSWSAPPDDVLAIKDIRDLRFMAEIFTRQKCATELLNMWASPPEHLKMLFLRHRDDLLAVQARVARTCKEWELLSRHCEDTIQEKISNLDIAKNSNERIRELCAWNSEIWDFLIDAVKRVPGGSQARIFIQRQTAEIFGFDLKSMDRPIQLTYMKLRKFTEELTVTDCKRYFENHGHLISCFRDLRSFMTEFSKEETIDFLKSISRFTRTRAKTCDNTQGFDNWQQLELNVLKFLYLAKISRNPDLQLHTVEPLLERTLALYALWPDSSVGYLAVYILLTMNSLLVTHGKDDPIERYTNSRLLLQATMFVRIMVAKDKEKQNRTISLLAARLHLNLGLGSVAFQLYRHVKCKEMLQDTLSLYLLQHISKTHPMDVAGYRGFSAAEELDTVCTTIERMERKTDNFLYTDLPSFRWDQGFNLWALKNKLRCSHTKIMCLGERHSIVWLKGESDEYLPKFNSFMQTKPSDSTDKKVFEHFDIHETSNQATHIIVPNTMPDPETCTNLLYARRMAQMILDGARVPAASIIHAVERIARFDPYENHALSENEVEQMRAWNMICICITQVELEHALPLESNINDIIWFSLPELLRDARRIHETLRLPSDTALSLEDEPTMSHETMLYICITWLDVIRTAHKLSDYLREKLLKTKSKMLLKVRASLPKRYVENLEQEAKVFYTAIQDIAQSYIDLLNRRGVKAMVAQVRWGKSGELLRKFLTDDDVDYYAREYVESAVEGWKGVTKLKLK